MAKNQAAVELGRLGVAARNRKLTQARRIEIARLAAKARWSKTPPAPRPSQKKEAVA